MHPPTGGVPPYRFSFVDAVEGAYVFMVIIADTGEITTDDMNIHGVGYSRYAVLCQDSARNSVKSPLYNINDLGGMFEGGSPDDGEPTDPIQGPTPRVPPSNVPFPPY